MQALDGNRRPPGLHAPPASAAFSRTTWPACASRRARARWRAGRQHAAARPPRPVSAARSAVSTSVPVGQKPRGAHAHLRQLAEGRRGRNPPRVDASRTQRLQNRLQEPGRPRRTLVDWRALPDRAETEQFWTPTDERGFKSSRPDSAWRSQAILEASVDPGLRPLRGLRPGSSKSSRPDDPASARRCMASRLASTCVRPGVRPLALRTTRAVGTRPRLARARGASGTTRSRPDLGGALRQPQSSAKNFTSTGLPASCAASKGRPSSVCT
jgi:hypothetical protein